MADADKLLLAVRRFAALRCFAGDGKCSEHLPESLEEY